VIAAVVSVAVAAASVIITFVTTRASLRRDHERQAAEFGRAMTARLCDRRVAVHPGLFQITGAFRNTRLAGAANLDGHLTQALARVGEWHCAEGGLILSTAACTEMIELSRAIRAYLGEPADSGQLDQLKHDIWRRRGRLRAAMRAGLGLLFGEDQPVTEHI